MSCYRNGSSLPYSPKERNDGENTVSKAPNHSTGWGKSLLISKNRPEAKRTITVKATELRDTPSSDLFYKINQ
jgi:hypothetical protein